MKKLILFDDLKSQILFCAQFFHNLNKFYFLYPRYYDFMIKSLLFKNDFKIENEYKENKIIIILEASYFYENHNLNELKLKGEKIFLSSKNIDSKDFLTFKINFKYEKEVENIYKFKNSINLNIENLSEASYCNFSLFLKTINHTKILKRKNNNKKIKLFLDNFKAETLKENDFFKIKHRNKDFILPYKYYLKKGDTSLIILNKNEFLENYYFLYLYLLYKNEIFIDGIYMISEENKRYCLKGLTNLDKEFYEIDPISFNETSYFIKNLYKNKRSSKIRKSSYGFSFQYINKDNDLINKIIKTIKKNEIIKIENKNCQNCKKYRICQIF